MKNNTLYLTQASLIAALYVMLTIISNFAGLAVGCAVANLATGCALWDVAFGTLATTLGALGTYYIGRKFPYAGPAFPIAANALIVPKVLQVVYGAEGTYWYFMLTVGIGEILSCGVLGIILYRVLRKTKIFEE